MTDSNGLKSTSFVIIYPDKVNLTFNTVPAGLTLYFDGIARATPFTASTLIGFKHNVEARNQTGGGSSYTFASWSDGGAQQHDVVVPSTNQSYNATYTVSSAPVPITFKQLNYSTPQTNQSTVNTAYTTARPRAAPTSSRSAGTRRQEQSPLSPIPPETSIRSLLRLPEEGATSAKRSTTRRTSLLPRRAIRSG